MRSSAEIPHLKGYPCPPWTEEMCAILRNSQCAHTTERILTRPIIFLPTVIPLSVFLLIKLLEWHTSPSIGVYLRHRMRTVFCKKANEADAESARRILIKGKATVSYEAAEVFAEAGVVLVGNESQTVGPEDAPMAVHRLLLGVGTVLLEGIRLCAVDEGVYFLNAAPLCLGGSDGAPCRALLIK